MPDCTAWLDGVLAKMQAAPTETSREAIASEAIGALSPENCGNLRVRTELICRIEEAITP